MLFINPSFIDCFIIYMFTIYIPAMLLIIIADGIINFKQTTIYKAGFYGMTVEQALNKIRGDYNE